MRSWKLLLPLLASTLCLAAQPDRITGTIDSGQMVAVAGQIQHRAKPQYDQGAVSASFQLNQVTLLTLPTPSQQKALSALVAEQQNPSSANYHKWLTPEQYADRFGLSQNDVQKISAWLKSQGLSVVSVARGRNWIVFSGTAAQVETAFRTEIHRYNINGEIHFANATAPSVPAALSGIVTGIRGFDDFLPKPASVRKAAPKAGSARSDYYDSSFPADFVAPGDIETIYDLTPLYNAGINGTGQKMVIVGQTDVYLADLVDFRSGFGLNPISGCTTNTSGIITACTSTYFQYVLPTGVTDLGTPSTCGDLTEADLDLEWSGAIVPNAQIIYVNTPVTYNTACTEILSGGNGVFSSFYYAIDNDLAPVISMSYGAPCEFDENALPNDEIELTKANTLGITFMNSSGDSGAASCDGGSNSATNNLAIGGLAVSYPASSPEVTGVGGTAIVYPTGFSSTFWGTTNPTNGGTAQNPPLPETSWNDDVELALADSTQFNTALLWQENYAIVQSGGGASNCSVQTSDNSNCVSGFPQPSWQTVTVSGQSGARLVPDVSLLGSPNFPGYIFCTPLDQWLTDSTSAASSCAPGGAAGITAALALTDPGNDNQPAPTVVGGTSASSPVFAAIVTLLNQYLGTNGLGNINPTLYTLAKTPSNGAFHQVTTGDNIVYCEGGTPPAPWPTALQCPGATGTTGSFGYEASNADTATGYNLVTGLGSVDANNLALAWKATLEPDFQLTASPLSLSLPAGQAATVSLTITPVTGSTGMVVNFSPSSCTGLPVGATCKFSEPSVNFDGVDPATITVTISTQANMAIPSSAQTISITPTNSSNTTATVSLTITKTTETFTIGSTVTNFQESAGATATVSITVSSMTGFVLGTGTSATTALPLTYSCTGIPTGAEITCAFSPTNGQAVSATTVTLNITTTAPVTQLRPPLGGGSRIFYAFLLPGLFGVVFAAGSRTCGARLLGLIVVLGVSTLWLGACGGSNSSQNNPGTPAGTYSVAVNATTTNTPTGGTALTTTPLTITLTVSN